VHRRGAARCVCPQRMRARNRRRSGDRIQDNSGLCQGPGCGAASDRAGRRRIKDRLQTSWTAQGLTMAKQRISYVPLEQMDAEMRKEMERCQREGTPRPESTAVRAHVPACFWFFANSWNDIFRNGILDHALKELCRVYVSRSVICEFCGNQRSIKGSNEGLKETHYDDLINFEKSVKYDER